MSIKFGKKSYPPLMNDGRLFMQDKIRMDIELDTSKKLGAKHNAKLYKKKLQESEQPIKDEWTIIVNKFHKWGYDIPPVTDGFACPYSINVLDGKTS